MRIDPKTPLWVVTDPGRLSDLDDICFESTLDGLRLQFAGGLSMDRNPTLFTNQEEAHAEAKQRLLLWRVAERIRLERRLAPDEAIHVTLHDADGKVVWRGEVR